LRVALPDLVRTAARSHPDGVAVVDGSTTLTYAELDAGSNRLAQLLLSLGVERGDRVGLFLDKSAAAVTGIYGVMKAGACYVPIDPRSPPPRAGYIAHNCGLRVLLTARKQAATWPEILEVAKELEHLVVVDRDDVSAFGPEEPGIILVDQDLAYILYTSGSTGEPKGVSLTHRNALAFVAWAAEEFAVSPTDRLSSHAPFHFDLSVFDLYAAAWAAAPVVLVPDRVALFPIEIGRFIRDQGITIWYSVPSLLTALVTHGGLRPGDLPGLRTILFAGEVFPTRHLRALMTLLPHTRFANLYGPTETNVCTWYDVRPLPPDEVEPVPIGQPITNDDVYVVTDDGRLATPGEIGELYERGATVMRGYWADPDRTAASLLPDPFAAAFPDPVYRTGDLVREDPDGNLRYLGRRDSQIKSRGYRIELGEIENALNAHPEVEECAVVAVPDELITNTIRAFVVTSTDERELVRFCAERIPRYMLPHEFVVVASLPRTSTGKINRQSLAGGEESSL
jgi:amino acid adenylation domain-containing protein